MIHKMKSLVLLLIFTLFGLSQGDLEWQKRVFRSILSPLNKNVQCSEGTYFHDGVCLPKSSTVCPEETVYDNGVCQLKSENLCPIDMTYDSGVCVHNFMDFCTKNDSCTKPIICENTERSCNYIEFCEDEKILYMGRCIAQPVILCPRRSALDKGHCIRKQTESNIDDNECDVGLVKINDVCLSPADFFCPNDTELIEGTCVTKTKCPPNTYLFNDLCVECPENTHFFNGNCLSCHEGMIFHNGNCICPENRILFDGQCLEPFMEIEDNSLFEITNTASTTEPTVEDNVFEITSIEPTTESISEDDMLEITSIEPTTEPIVENDHVLEITSTEATTESILEEDGMLEITSIEPTTEPIVEDDDVLEITSTEPTTESIPEEDDMLEITSIEPATEPNVEDKLTPATTTTEAPVEITESTDKPNLEGIEIGENQIHINNVINNINTINVPTNIVNVNVNNIDLSSYDLSGDTREESTTQIILEVEEPFEEEISIQYVTQPYQEELETVTEARVPQESDAVTEEIEKQAGEDVGCCLILEPRVCGTYENQYKCIHRRYHVCGEICNSDNGPSAINVTEIEQLYNLTSLPTSTPTPTTTTPVALIPPYPLIPNFPLFNYPNPVNFYNIPSYNPPNYFPSPEFPQNIVNYWNYQSVVGYEPKTFTYVCDPVVYPFFCNKK